MKSPRPCTLLAILGAALLGVAGLLLPAVDAQAQRASQSAPLSPYQQDLEALCRFVADEYAYFDRRPVNWAAACDSVRAAAGQVPDLVGFITLLESLLGELADPHASLSSSHAQSRRLVPTDADLLVRWVGSEVVVQAVRAGSGAAQAGVAVGMRILAVDGVDIARAAREFEPRHWPAPSTAQDQAHWLEARQVALQWAVAGRQNGQAVQLRLRAPTADSQAPPDRTVSFLPGLARPASALTLQIIEPLPDKPVAWVRLHNSLGNQAAVAEWDAAMDQARATHALVLDLRDTPSGGNTTVARSLMGRLVAQPQAYQQHELASEWRRHGVRRVWTEQVWPRGITYRRPVIVLVGPWTGSMGEGTAVGLHAARDAAVVGEPMAGLLGGLGSLTLANSRITVRIPTERLNHVNGTPREHFQPCDASRWPLPAISGSRFERGGADRLVWAAALAAVSVRVPSAHNCS